jgi:hypothetical protein
MSCSFFTWLVSVEYDTKWAQFWSTDIIIQYLGSGFRMAKMTHKNRKNKEISCLEGLKASSVAWTSFLDA